jgi:cytochrome c oxidase subunit 2
MSYDEKRDAIAEEVAPIFSHSEPFYKKTVAKIILIWAIFTAIGIVIALMLPQHMFPYSMGIDMHDVTNTFVIFTIAAAPIAALVYAIAAYSLIGWRKKGANNNDDPPEDGSPIRGSSVVTTIWLGVSVALVLFLLIWGMAELTAETAQQANTLEVNVTGQQWMWTFSYPGTGITTHNLVLPEGRQIQFNVTSMDVTHGFWPVQLGVQIDANPNVVDHILSSTDRLGTFNVRCSQLCGLYHSYMQTSGKVVTSSQFASWLTSQGASASSVQSYALSGK